MSRPYTACWAEMETVVEPTVEGGRIKTQGVYRPLLAEKQSSTARKSRSAGRHQAIVTNLDDVVGAWDGLFDRMVAVSQNHTVGVTWRVSMQKLHDPALFGGVRSMVALIGYELGIPIVWVNDVA